MADIALLVVSSGAVISSMVLLTKKIQHCSCCKGCIDCQQDTSGSKDRTSSPREQQINQVVENQQEMARRLSGAPELLGDRDHPVPRAFMPPE